MTLSISHPLEFHGQNGPVFYFFSCVGGIRLGANCKNLVMEAEH